MHLLAAKPGAVADGAEAIDLGQTPGDIVILSAADTDLACLAQARAGLGDDFPSLRLANLLHLSHNLSVDLYVEQIIEPARLVLVRLIGGVGYWPYGVEQLAASCRDRNIPIGFVPGDEQPDPELMSRSTLPTEAVHRMWQFCVQGGVENAGNLLNYAASLIGQEREWREPAALPKAGLYWPGMEHPSLSDLEAGAWRDLAATPVVPIIFYRALVQAGNTAPVHALIISLAGRGLRALPVYVSSLKDAVSAALLGELLERCPPSAILNATGFAVSKPGAAASETPFDAADCPVLQMIFSGGDREGWEDGTNGLSARDIAMNVALPEVDGRVLSRAVSFKAEDRFDAATQCAIVGYAPVEDRIEFVAALAANWTRLRNTPVEERRVVLVLANYPNRDGRLGNGVGLDTPAAAINVLRALKDAGYNLSEIPKDGDALMRRLSAGPTNALAGRRDRIGGVTLPIASYQSFFDRLPEANRTALTERWGDPASDPFIEADNFRFGVLELGQVVIAIQPARGYNIDPVATYHDPDLVPPHGYLAMHHWIRNSFDAHAIVHLGKHGNLEWLPGKALALSQNCWPEVALGPLPNLYPFIVNDPGEGTQAKRRSAAVIIDHLTPPLTRAESYGPLKELEVLADEYYEAAGIDPRRLRVLSERIFELISSTGIDKDFGITLDDDDQTRLAKLDNHLCELKELQIRDGLHILGITPEGRLLDDLLVALVRVPRGDGAGGKASLQRALAADLGLDGFDPLDCEMGAAWTGLRPDVLAKIDTEQTWRIAGDSVERLELLSSELVSGARTCPESWPKTAEVLAELTNTIRPAVEACGPAEIAALLQGLAGRFVAPGPSGAPTRGRPEVLPTGRNFYSVDTRSVPTPAAWHLGWKAAGILLDRHRQEHGAWPKRMALSAWGTANMRTGGDDIAQALALMGARPQWDVASGRVTGFEILPLSILDRPRIDVTFRVSGFFRDAFPYQIDLLDSAARAIAELDEPEAKNPLAAHVRSDAAALVESGLDADAAQHRAGHRIFGSKPGAYGAGLQALIDEKLWTEEADLARAYVAWGGYAYGGGSEGVAEHALFERRLKDVELVLHNQDNREHDLLDSDDYYQFEGGLAAAVHHLSGTRPVVYHGDHSRPESPRIRTLEEEIARVVRGRVVNPKWIAGVIRHGYKGAFEMAATVDYMFAFAATTGAVADHHFDAVMDAYLEDDEVRAFLETHNPVALKEMAERLSEALERNLWRPKSNTVALRLAEFVGGG